MKKVVLLGILLFLTVPQFSFAGTEVINQLRFFYGQNQINPSEVNDLADTASLKQFKKVNHFGVEAMRVLIPQLNLGFRLGLKNYTSNPTDESSTNNYYATLNQINYTAVLASPLVKTDRFQMEVVAGFGTSDSSLKIKSATEDGTYTSSKSIPTLFGGLSFAYGYKYVFLKIEGGYEYNKADNLSKSGTLTTSIKKLDFSGTYFNVGLLIDGLALGRL